MRAEKKAQEALVKKLQAKKSVESELTAAKQAHEEMQRKLAEQETKLAARMKTESEFEKERQDMVKQRLEESQREYESAIKVKRE